MLLDTFLPKVFNDRLTYLSYNLMYSWNTKSSHFRYGVVIITSFEPIKANAYPTFGWYGVFIYCLAFQVVSDPVQNKTECILRNSESFLESFIGICCPNHLPPAVAPEQTPARSYMNHLHAKFSLHESNKVPAKDKRRAICRLLNAMSICALSENNLLRSFSREIALIRAILSFTATIFESWIMARRYYIGPRPFSFSLLEIKIRFDTRCTVSIRCRANIAPKSNQTQLGSAWVERRLNRALLKATNQHLSEDLLSRGVPDLQNRSQHLLTTLFSQQHNYKLRILKIWQTIKLIERIKLPKSAIVVSMDVTSLYTNIPQREGITTVCMHMKNFTKETLQSLPGF